MTIEKLTAAVYDPAGVTLLGQLGHMQDGEYRDEISQRGNGKFRIPLDDAEDVVADSVVKFTWRGSVRFGCVISSGSCELAVNGRRWLHFDNQPGLFSLLDSALVEPEYGLRRASGDQRNFGFMSQDGPWRIPSEWATPHALAWSDMTGRRHNSPPELRAANPDWLSDDDIDLTRPAGTVLYFRATLTLPHYMDVNLIFTADNFLDLYLDGEQVMSKDPTLPNGWHTATTVTKSLAGGTHQLAARIENAGPDVSPNPLGFIGIVERISAEGDPVEVLMTTNATDWEVSSGAPGWHKGQVLLKCVEEAQALAADNPYGVSFLTVTFTGTHDSDGDPWSDTPGQFAFGIETTTLADLAAALGESGINIYVDAATMTLNAYNRMGADRFSTVHLELARDGGSLVSYQTTEVSSRATSVTAHLEDGTWSRTDDTAGLAAVGRKAVGYALGTATDAVTARQFSREQLAESARPQHQFTARPLTSRGPQFYDQYGLGDSIKAPAHRDAGVTKVRALAVTVSQNGKQGVDVKPDLMEDFS